MKREIIIICLLCAAILYGCGDITEYYGTVAYVTGVNQYRNITKGGTVSVFVSGSGNYAYVDSGTLVSEVRISGTNNKINMSNVNTPIVYNSGTGNEVAYYP